MLAMLVLLGLVLVIGPIAAGIAGVALGAFATAFLMIAGALVLVVSSTMIVITRLYVKTRAYEAFVRTGMGGRRVIKDGGSVVIPVVHQIVPVTLETLRLKVVRRGAEALLTKDKLRADIEGEFFVRVMPNDEDIINAARSLGEKTANEEIIKKLIEDKLVSALRTAAATRTLEELNTERDLFVKRVMELVTDDLKHNGFTLETVTISSLDQASTAELRDDNIFDAQGKRTIAEITQEQWTRRNEIERAAQQARLQQDVVARQKMLEMEKNRAEAEARQAAEIARIKAENELSARQAQIEAQRLTLEAELVRDNSIALRTQQNEQSVAVAEQEKEKNVALAQQERQKAMELAQRAREIAVAEQAAKLALAEKERLSAEKQKESEAQAVETVRVTATAERAQSQQVIAARGEAEKGFVAAQKKADADAYARQKAADTAKLAAQAEATAKVAAAEAEATAVRRRAEAESEASKLRAEGQQAESLVPVAVKAREVEVENQRVAVLQKELEAREKSGRVAQEFELAKLRIVQESQVRVETAKAMASFGARFEAKLVGTPEQVAQIQKALFGGMSAAAAIDGFFEGAGPQSKKLAEAAGQVLTDLAQVAGKRLADGDGLEHP